jgi:hypothetical protein
MLILTSGSSPQQSKIAVSLAAVGSVASSGKLVRVPALEAVHVCDVLDFISEAVA